MALWKVAAEAGPSEAVNQGGHNRGTRYQVIRRIVANRPLLLGILLTGLLGLTVLIGPMIVPLSPNEMDIMAIFQSPSAAHPFGTDEFGRDVLSRVLHGGRISFYLGMLVALATTVTALFFGVLSGYYSRIDAIVMRAMDVLMAFPAILLALGIMAILGPQLMNVVLALVFVYTPRSTRIVRGVVIAIREQEFVEAAKALGARDGRLLYRHVIPNSIAPLVVQQTFIFAYSILAEASLSFLGVGVPPNVPSWGSILSDGRSVLQFAPWMTLYPGLAISLVVLGVNLLGDGLRDFLDPRNG